MPVLNRGNLAAADSGHGDEPERARQENGVAACAGESRVGPAPRADQEADGEQGARALRAGARRDDARAAQGRARLLRGGHRQLDAVGVGRRGNRAGAVLRGRSADATIVRRR